jgi:translation initiation factor IF-3
MLPRSCRLLVARSFKPADLLSRALSTAAPRKTQQGGGGGGGGGNRSAPPSKGNNGGILKNEDIRVPSMRVVYSNPESGASEWKVLARKEALLFAAKMKLDLVMVDSKADPPVCRLANFGQLLMEKRSKEKEKKTSQKAKVLKEMYIKAGIDPHDLGIKLGKCKDFLDLGHQVKIVLTVAKVTLAANPLALDETTLKILENLESHVGTVQQPAQSSSMRKDFLLNPKSGAKPSPKS